MYGRRLLLIPALLTLALSGCCGCGLFHHRDRCCPPPAPPPIVPAPRPVVPACPPGTSGYLPPGTSGYLPQAPLPAETTSPGENVAQEPTWRPGPDRLTEPSGVRLQAPETVPEERRDSARQAPSDTREPPLKTPAPSVKEEQKPDTPPLDLPGYAIARAKVYNGQQPFRDGIKWLKEHGFRAVLHVRAPDEDDAAARRMFEKEGLRYESIEVSPRTLNRDLIERFNKLVTDDARLPLFVYDKDGALTGVLWYLYYRIAVNMDDARAREEAARLGFKPESEDQRTLVLAAQKLLEEMK